MFNNEYLLYAIYFFIACLVSFCLIVIFSRKVSDSKVQEYSGILPFKDGFSAFEYICEYMEVSLAKDKPIPALVDLLPYIPIGTIDSDGYQVATLRIPHAKKLIYTVALCATKGGPILKKGDLVMWIPLKQSMNEAADKKMYDANLGELTSWVGRIVLKLDPTYNYKTKLWKVL